MTLAVTKSDCTPAFEPGPYFVELFLYAVNVVDIWRKGSLQNAHKCPLSVVGECEIIDSGVKPKGGAT